jgi:DNA-binding LytR/AlgR family response regulator
VTAGEQRYLVRSSLDALERTLPAAFMRVHRSWIVPRDRIVAVRRSASGAHREIVLRSGVVVPVSRRRQAQVMRLLRGSIPR